MCGIVGYIGKRKSIDVLLSSLRKLEYRGYDSSGIALKNSDDIQIIKSIGEIKNLEEKVFNTKLIDSNIGIAHTRWATHGRVNIKNAHPHMFGKITLVHNGIIENVSLLKNELIKEGYIFNSDTDSEVIACLIDKYYKDDIIFSINETMKLLKGSYALGIIVEDVDELYAVKKDSPLVLGIGDDEYYLASDIVALNSCTNQYILLDDYEIACIGSDLTIIKDNKEINKEIFKLNIEDNNNSNSNSEYDYYMLREIMEEPYLIKNLLSNIGDIPNIRKYDEIHIVGCGSAYYAGMISKSLIEEYSNVKVICEIASEYRYKKVFYDKNILVILISQSGETADTIAALRKAKENGIDTLVIVNVKTSTIARESDKQIFIEAGSEIAVATTKAFLLQVLVLSLISLYNSKYKDDKVILEEVNQLPLYVEELLSKKDIYLNVAKMIYNENNVMFIGRKIDYAICLEGSLKLKEVSYIYSEAYQAGELKHGPIALINEGCYVFVIVTDDLIRDKTISNVEEIRARGAIPIYISNVDNVNYHYKIIVKKINPFIQSLLIIPCLQLIAYEVARLRNCDIDKPRNLAKSVTVE